MLQYLCFLNNKPPLPPIALVGYQISPTVIEILPKGRTVAYVNPTAIQVEDPMLDTVHTFQELLNTLTALAPISPPPTIPSMPKEDRVLSHGANWSDSSDSEEESVDPRQYDDDCLIHLIEPVNQMTT